MASVPPAERGDGDDDGGFADWDEPLPLPDNDDHGSNSDSTAVAGTGTRSWTASLTNPAQARPTARSRLSVQSLHGDDYNGDDDVDAIRCASRADSVPSVVDDDADVGGRTSSSGHSTSGNGVSSTSDDSLPPPPGAASGSDDGYVELLGSCGLLQFPPRRLSEAASELNAGTSERERHSLADDQHASTSTLSADTLAVALDMGVNNERTSGGPQSHTVSAACAASSYDVPQHRSEAARSGSFTTTLASPPPGGRRPSQRAPGAVRARAAGMDAQTNIQRAF